MRGYFFGTTIRYVPSSHQRCSVRKCVLRNFAKFTGKSLRQIIFLIKLQASDHRPTTLLKKNLWNRCFPVNFVKFLRTPFYRTHLGNCFCTCNERTISSYFGKCEYDYCFNMLQEHDNNIFKEC